MPSTLACIGLDVADLETLNAHLEAMPAEVAGRVAGVESVRYADASGARVVVAVDEDGDTLDLVPSYDGRPGALLADLGPLGTVVTADVLDDDNEVVTRLAVDLEQHRHLSTVVPGPLRASVVAMGIEVSVHADAAAFGASDDSLLGEPVAGARPTRLAPESLIPYGLSDDADAAQPTAFLAGTVLDTATRTHGATGQDFHVARVRTAGFDATVCLAASAHPTAPDPGNVVAGSCYLVVDVPTLWTVEPRRRRRRGRR